MEANVLDRTGPGLLLIIGFWVAVTLIVTWGEACVLVTGRSLLGKKDVSPKTFDAIKQESSGLIVPLFLTELLYTCFSVFWAILLIIPGIIYGIRAAFYYVIIGTEGISYREALNRSKDIVRGKTWDAFLAMVTIAIVLFAPVLLAATILYSTVETIDARFVHVVSILQNGAMSVMTIIAILSMMLLYKQLKES